MTQTYRLKKGKILFEKDKIIISDKAKMQKYIILFSTGLWILIAIKNGMKLENINDDFLDFVFLILGILNLLLFVVTLLRSTKSIILLDEVNSIEVKQRFKNYSLDIRLKNNRIRRVSQIDEAVELEEYVEKYYMV